MKTITLDNELDCNNTIFVDVRSHTEFIKGHIPDAIHMPILTDEERKEVGNLYKTVGSNIAKERGLAFASIKLPLFADEIKKLSKAGAKIIVYCWRGGLRSRAIVTILELIGMDAAQLTGGYKAYRSYILKQLTNFHLKAKIVILCGSTGVGKTMILECLQNNSIPVINLEELAKHRGSVFGNIGLGNPETAQNFDSLLLRNMEKLNDYPYIVVECESKRIGNVYIPDVLFSAMQNGIKIILSADIDTRITRLMDEYTQLLDCDNAIFEKCINILGSRLGKIRMQTMLFHLNQGNIREIVRILLIDYYDPLYGYEKKSKSEYNFHVNAEDITIASQQIIKFLDSLRE